MGVEVSEVQVVADMQPPARVGVDEGQGVLGGGRQRLLHQRRDACSKGLCRVVAAGGVDHQVRPLACEDVVQVVRAGGGRAREDYDHLAGGSGVGVHHGERG